MWWNSLFLHHHRSILPYWVWNVSIEKFEFVFHFLSNLIKNQNYVHAFFPAAVTFGYPNQPKLFHDLDFGIDMKSRGTEDSYICVCLKFIILFSNYNNIYKLDVIPWWGLNIESGLAVWRTVVDWQQPFRQPEQKSSSHWVRDCRMVRHHQRSSHHSTNLNNQIPFWSFTRGLNTLSIWCHGEFTTVVKYNDFVRKIKK